MKKVEPLILGLLLISSFVYSLHPTKIVNAQLTPSEPNWAIPGVTFSYGWQLWEYFPTSNLSSEILFMEQYFNIGYGNYTPKKRWESVFNLTLISKDSQQGVFQLSVGNQTQTWKYIWSNQTWQVNGQQQGFLAIYVPPAQLSGNPMITIGSYRVYKVISMDSSTNRTLYKYYQKDTGILLLEISVAILPTGSDLIVMGLASTSIQIPQTISISFQQYTFSVTSNSTISSVIYNSTTNVLSFSVSGPAGTNGYAEVSIPKELCPNISNLRVYVDGNEVEYEYTSDDDSWIIKITYQHSTHNIQIIIPEFSLLVLIACMLATTVTFSSLHMKPRKKLLNLRFRK